MEISVIIPVYNAAGFVEKAVDSAIQFEDVKEVLLIEDRSTDNSLQVCKGLLEKDIRIKIFQHPDKGNHGAGATRNLGITNASFEFIAFLDADDFYLPNRFDADKKVFAENPDADGVYNALGFFYYSQSLRFDDYSKGQETLSTIRDRISPELLPYALIGEPKHIGYITLDALTIRKELALKGGLFNEKLKLHQDTDFIFKLSLVGKLLPGEIKKPVGMRGVHNNNRSLDIPNLIQTRKLLHKSISDWCMSNSLDKELTDVATNKYYISLMSDSSFLVRVLIFIKRIATNKSFFLRPRFFNPAIKMITGDGFHYRLIIKTKEKCQLILGYSLD